ncbi:MAG TPA: sigma-70 family RNA polymerase sigma factor [Chthonomonadaceae bacterium]|nr:sigma-70 family RNA polymerase sigma factor [Chthonomonadaceae bacterium]
MRLRVLDTTERGSDMVPPLQQTEGGQVPRLVEDFFRHEAGRLVSTLTRLFGIEHLDLAEDVVQETLVKALRLWPLRGIPSLPAAWITQAAKNGVRDALRREACLRRKAPEVLAWMQQNEAVDTEAEALRRTEALQDDQLRMMFTCCHPALSREAQVALTLKTLCGFTVAEVASAFLTEEATIAQRLTRAKRTLRQQRVSFTVPEADALPQRLDTVLQVLYLLFNEGYNAHAGENLIRQDLCQQAIYLATLLTAHPQGDVPRAHALLALLLFQASRLAARLDAEGNLLLLSEQDRSLWDRRMITLGFRHFDRSIAGDAISPYHIEAHIAACHAAAPSYEETDWEAILHDYDDLLTLNNSPVIALNRAVALSMRHGSAAGLRELENLKALPMLDAYHLLPATLAALAAKQGDRAAAQKYYREALDRVASEPERRFLQRKLTELQEGA